LPTSVLAVLLASFLLVAALYSSVGHAGASGYLAIMALAGLDPATMKSAALVMNLCVAGLATWRYVRAGHFRFGLFWPFALASVPCAFAGGAIRLPPEGYQPLLALVLLAAAARLLLAWGEGEVAEPRPPRTPVALGAGAAIGFVSGLTGTGGGIFLSPLALLRRWAKTREVAALSAVFILVNSSAGLLGHTLSTFALPRELPWFVASAVLGGLAGSWLGAHKLDPRLLRRLLGLVLLVAAAKLLLHAP
jgi:hypothetical protein